MPTIRDGRGVLVVHDMSTPPAGSAVGSIERRQVSAQRMADFAAERAAAAEHDRPKRDLRPVGSAGAKESSQRGLEARWGKKPTEEAPVATLPHHDAGRMSEPRPPKPAGPGAAAKGQSKVDRDARATRVLEALEHHGGSVDAAAAELGMRRNAVTMVAKHARIRTGETPPQPVREQPRLVAPADISLEGQEAGAPATDAGDRAPRAVAVPPPGPPEPPEQLRGVRLPCRSCSHAAVCAIRPKLEAAIKDRPRMAPVDPAVTFATQIQVTCGHYHAVGA